MSKFSEYYSKYGMLGGFSLITTSLVKKNLTGKKFEDGGEVKKPTDESDDDNLGSHYEGESFDKGGRVHEVFKLKHIESKKWWDGAPENWRKDFFEYWANQKILWNKKEIELSKTDIEKLKAIQKMVSENYPEYNHLFDKHSK